MKKLLFILCIVLFEGASAFAFISGYFGVNAGGVGGKSSGFNSTKNSLGSTVGVNLGIETNLLLAKVGAEAFLDKSLAFKSKSGNNESYEYKNPLFYGIKGKIMVNLILFEPFLSIGYGIEKRTDFKNDFGLIGIGVQARLYQIGAWAELSYLKSLHNKHNTKTDRTSLQVGLKYFFL